MKHLISRIMNTRKGTSSVIFTFAFTVIIAITALTVDVGMAYVEKSKLSATVDSAALAGAQEFITGSGNERYIVDNYIKKNMGTLNSVNVSVDSVNHIVEVKASKTIDSYFAKILGIKNFKIDSEAAAKVDNIKSLKGVRPLAVIHQDFIYGNLYTLKEGAGDGTSGNYAAIALGGTGSSIYKSNMLGGYGSVISVGDTIETETGNMSGTTATSIQQLIQSETHTPPCTYQYYNKNCSKIIFIPIVDTLDINGRKYVKVLGFATFFLESAVDHGGQTDITGRFITYSANGETSSDINDYGTYGIRLIK